MKHDVSEQGESPFAVDLTARARAGQVGPVVGREAEVRRLIEILVRRDRANPLVVGERGVGKTSVIEGLALRIASGDVPAGLRDVRLLVFDLAAIGAVRELERLLTQPVIVVLDDLHTMAARGVPVASALGAVGSPGAARVIATATPVGERERLAGLPVLRRHFHRMDVAEASVGDTTAVLRGLRSRLEEHHGIVITDAALEAAATLADRHLTGRFLPEKAVDLVEEAAARLLVDGLAEDGGALGADDVARALDVPVERLEGREAVGREDATPGTLGPGDPVRIGAHRVLRRLGQGGQGVVYLAEDGRGERVAIKVLHAASLGDARARERFVREIEAARRVASFCTARVLEAAFEGEVPYVVSEYVEGPSLRQAVTAGGPRAGGALDRLAIGTITALAAIAEAGIVHRDFKPDNVLLAADGLRVIDFGIARVANAGSSVTGHVIGTPAYMAPEQFEGGAVGPPADVYAWACAMVYAATGRPPHGADSIPQIMYRKLRGEAEFGEFAGRASGALAAMVERGLSRDPGVRPAAKDILLSLIGHGDVAPTGLLAEGAAIATRVTDWS
ncbi:protein kinase domain-containing protein [Actinomadura terrae]|uniref:protein kinase domain-containing protein n=1 Tax=Actinomadura terrae TaxID=604353 RepID=UPI001FA71C3A|nr:protein kinase [Actinomadura terrae]